MTTNNPFEKPRRVKAPATKSTHPFTVVAENTHIKKGKNENIWVQITAQAPKPSATHTRLPLDLALVIDRSGSMSGDRLQNALLAAEHVISQLGADDRVSVIVYDQMVTLLADASTDHAQTIQKLKTVTPGGMTALAPALYEGLEKLSAVDTTKRLPYLFLLSDGHANVGETNPTSIANSVQNAASRGIRVAAFGMGDGYNEILMEAIATAGGGGYHYLANADDAPAAFKEELGDVFSITLTNVRVAHKAAAGVRVVRVTGWDRMDASTGEAIFGDIPGDAKRTLLLELEVDAQKAGDQALIAVTGTYMGEGDTTPQHASVTTSVTVTTSDAKIKAGVNTEVAAKVAEIQAAEAQRKAAELADQGQYIMAHQAMSDAHALVTQTMAFAPSTALADKLSDLTDGMGLVASEHSYSAGAAKRIRSSSYKSRRSNETK